MTSLLYGCETWTLNTQQIKRLEKFHLSTLRKIARIRWYHKVTNYQVLSRCKIPSLQSMIDKAKLRWTGHVVRMDKHRIPKALLYGRLATGTPRQGNHSTYLNSVKRTLKACGLDHTPLEELASDRVDWRLKVQDGVRKAADKEDRTQGLKDKRARGKERAGFAGPTTG